MRQLGPNSGVSQRARHRRLQEDDAQRHHEIPALTFPVKFEEIVPVFRTICCAPNAEVGGHTKSAAKRQQYKQDHSDHWPCDPPRPRLANQIPLLKGKRRYYRKLGVTV